MKIFWNNFSVSSFLKTHFVCRARHWVFAIIFLVPVTWKSYNFSRKMTSRAKTITIAFLAQVGVAPWRRTFLFFTTEDIKTTLNIFFIIIIFVRFRRAGVASKKALLFTFSGSCRCRAILYWWRRKGAREIFNFLEFKLDESIQKCLYIISTSEREMKEEKKS